MAARRLVRASQVAIKFSPRRLPCSPLGLFPVRYHGSGSHVHEEHKKNSAAEKITTTGTFVNIALAGGKGIAGIYSNSSALLADAGHSLSDLVTDAMTFYALRVSARPADENHPYGHGKSEAIGALLVSVALGFAGLGVGYHAYETLLAVTAEDAAATATGTPMQIALAVGAGSVLAKEWLFQATMSVAKKENSQALVANAWHHRSDALSSVVAVLGIGGSMAGFPLLDPVAGICVAGMVVKASGDIGFDSIRSLMDSADEELVKNVTDELRAIPGLVGFGNVRARRYGPKSVVDLAIVVPPTLSVSAAHHLAEQVRFRVMGCIPHVSEVLVHVDAATATVMPTAPAAANASAAAAPSNISDANPPSAPAGLTGTTDHTLSPDSGGAESEAEGMGSSPLPEHCPTAALQRTPEEVEQAVTQSLLRGEPRIYGVTHVTSHYLDGRICVEASICVDPSLRVSEVNAMARAARQRCEEIHDVSSADIHLELDDGVPHVVATSGEDEPAGSGKLPSA